MAQLGHRQARSPAARVLVSLTGKQGQQKGGEHAGERTRVEVTLLSAPWSCEAFVTKGASKNLLATSAAKASRAVEFEVIHCGWEPSCTQLLATNFRSTL